MISPGCKVNCGRSTMRLRQFEICRFKGENNVGKSTVLQALEQFLNGTQIRDEAFCHNSLTDEANAIELIGHFDTLTDAETQAIAVRGRHSNGEWILKKRFWRDEAAG